MGKHLIDSAVYIDFLQSGRFHWESKYYPLLSREPAEVLGVVLAAPDIESSISKDLTARFNYNRDKYDKIIDHVYNERRK